MKKGKLINHPVSELIASLGHTDEIVIADAGLPIPEETKRIDLALTPGVPSFQDVLKTVLEEMFVEKGFVSEDIQSHSPQMLELILSSLEDAPVEHIPHLDFKERTKKSRAVIRTGEFTPYANVILVSGPWGFNV
jgi:D-ribose pyranase